MENQETFRKLWGKGGLRRTGGRLARNPVCRAAPEQNMRAGETRGNVHVTIWGYGITHTWGGVDEKDCYRNRGHNAKIRYTLFGRTTKTKRV